MTPSRALVSVPTWGHALTSAPDRVEQLGALLASLPRLRPDIAARADALADTLRRAAKADTVAALGAIMVVAEEQAAALHAARYASAPGVTPPAHIDPITREAAQALIDQVGQLTFATLHRESCGPALYTAFSALRARLK